MGGSGPLYLSCDWLIFLLGTATLWKLIGFPVRAASRCSSEEVGGGRRRERRRREGGEEEHLQLGV